MDESCVAGTPSYDATDLTSLINGEDLSFFVPDSKGLISKGNFVCAKVLLAGVDAATAAYEYEIRSEVNIELNFPPKLRGARSRLYRRRFLQVNTRWKALAEIYTMHSFAPFSNLNFFVKNRQKILRLN